MACGQKALLLFLQNKINKCLPFFWFLVYPTLTHTTGNAYGLFHFGETALCATVIATTPPLPFFFFSHSQALKILPPCLDILKSQVFLTSTGVTTQNRVRDEKS